MSDDGVDMKKRRFLTATTSAVGLAGMGALAVGMVRYMGKSERAEQVGAPIEADISKLLPGKLMIIEWRSQPIWILKRTPDMINDMKILEEKKFLKDPDSKNNAQQPKYAENKLRSIEKHKETMVVIGLCTHLGCSPKQIDKTAEHELGTEWLGGFLCACHGSKFDFAGRVYDGVPAGDNLKVPKHYYKGNNDSVIVIGEDDPRAKGGAA